MGFASGYEPADDGNALAAVLHIDEPDDGEHDRADEIDDEILHRVDQADVKIAAKAEVTPIDRHLRDVVDMNGVIGVGRIEHHRADRMHDGVLLHVESEQHVHREFEELPDHADRHREAERHNRQVQRRQLELHTVRTVEQVDQRKADGGREEAVHRVQHRVPEREDLIERADLAQDLGREHEHQYDDLKRGRQFDAEPYLDERGRQ